MASPMRLEPHQPGEPGPYPLPRDPSEVVYTIHGPQGPTGFAHVALRGNAAHIHDSVSYGADRAASMVLRERAFPYRSI